MSTERFTIPTLIAFLQAAPSDDAVPQWLRTNDWVGDDQGPNIGDDISAWRWPPQTKIIDMSYMINNGVDCEFSDDSKQWFIGKLFDIRTDNGEYAYRKDHPNAGYRHCRPRHNEWLTHTGDKCPVPEGFTGKIRLANRTECEVHDLTEAFWKHPVATVSIISFMITGTAEGYCYTREV